MRLLQVLLLFTAVSYSVHAQTEFHKSYKDKPLNKALKEIIKDHNLKISYSPSLLKEYNITKEINASTIEELIEELLSDLPFDIKSSNNVLLIVPQQKKVLKGKIVDETSGNPLSYALVQSTTKSTVADQNGFFNLPPSEDTVTLKVSYLGYKKMDFSIPPNASNFQIHLEQNPFELQEVILDVNKENDLSVPVSSFTLNPKQFNSLPVLGETDVFKTMQLLPGISATNESTSGFQVRGSTAAQNLVLMDGFTLYHLDHFFGIFSTVNPNIINNVEIFKGGFGAEYGGRVSSVVNVSSRTGNREKISGGAGINFLSTNFHLDVPIGNKLNILVGLRNSFTGVIESDLYTDFLASSRQNFISSFDDPNLTSLELSPSLSFYDVNAKVTYQPSDKTTINANLYINEDNYEGTFIDEDDFARFRVTDEADWSNAGLSLNWDQMIGSNQVFGLSLNASEYETKESLSTGFSLIQDVDFEGDSIFASTIIEEARFGVQNSVNDVGIKLYHEYFISDQSELHSGLEINGIETSFRSSVEFEDFFSEETIDEAYLDSLEQSAAITSIFGSYTHRFGRLSSTLGFRSNYYDAGENWYHEPRINLAYQLSDAIQLKGSFSHHHQFLNQTSLSFINSGRFYWVLSDDDIIPVMKGRHLIFGAHYDKQNWRLEAELYRRRTTGVSANRYIRIPPEILLQLEEDDQFAGENISQGLDILLKYKAQTFNSWISYSLSSSRDRFEFFNENDFYSSDQDQRHEFNFVNMVKLGRWELASTFIYGTGRPFTPPVDDTDSDDGIFFEDIDRINSLRLPSYRRLDISAKYSFPWKKANCELGATLFNVLNFRNIKSRRYVKQFIFDEQFTEEEVEDEIRIVPLDTYLLGFTPNLFFNVRF